MRGQLLHQGSPEKLLENRVTYVVIWRDLRIPEQGLWISLERLPGEGGIWTRWNMSCLPSERVEKYKTEILGNCGLTLLVFFYFWLCSVFSFLIFSPISLMPKAVSEVPCGVIFTLISNLIPCNGVELRAVAQSGGHQCRKLEQVSPDLHGQLCTEECLGVPGVPQILHVQTGTPFSSGGIKQVWRARAPGRALSFL